MPIAIAIVIAIVIVTTTTTTTTTIIITKVENFDPSLCKLVTLGVQILRRLHYFFHVKINVHSCNGRRKDVDKFIKTFKGTSVEETEELSPCKCNKFGKHYISVKSMFFLLVNFVA